MEILKGTNLGRLPCLNKVRNLNRPLARWSAHSIRDACKCPTATGDPGAAGVRTSWRDPCVYFSNPRAHGCRELFVVDVPRIQDTRRLPQDHLGLFVGSRAMLDTAGHDDKLARPQDGLRVRLQPMLSSCTEAATAGQSFRWRTLNSGMPTAR